MVDAIGVRCRRCTGGLKHAHLVEDSPDDRGLGDQGDDLHATGTSGGHALERVRARLAMETEPGIRGDLLAAASRLGDDSALDELMDLADHATGDLIVDLHGTIVDLMRYPQRSTIATRAAELARTAHSPQLRARLAELARAAATET